MAVKFSLMTTKVMAPTVQVPAGTGAPTYENPGMAPQAKLVGVKVLDSGGSGSFAVVMAGMQWTIDNRYQYNIGSLNVTWSLWNYRMAIIRRR